MFEWVHISINWKLVLEICILWFVLYHVMLFLKDTKAVNLLRGIIILIIAFFIFQKLGLDTLNWILTKIFAISIIALFVIFQPELRQGLTRLGQPQIFYFGPKEEEIESLIKEVSAAASTLSKKNIGALIAIQRDVGLRDYMESGLIIDAEISSELLQSIFNPNSPLHDGGVIISNNRIMAVTCLFPLSENPDIDRALGMRHRAAVGLSEHTDAAVLVVSEETGDISLAVNGRLTRKLDKEDLVLILKGLFRKEKKKRR